MLAHFQASSAGAFLRITFFLVQRYEQNLSPIRRQFLPILHVITDRAKNRAIQRSTPESLQLVHLLYHILL